MLGERFEAQILLLNKYTVNCRLISSAHFIAPQTPSVGHTPTPLPLRPLIERLRQLVRFQKICLVSNRNNRSYHFVNALWTADWSLTPFFISPQASSVGHMPTPLPLRPLIERLRQLVRCRKLCLVSNRNNKSYHCVNALWTADWSLTPFFISPQASSIGYTPR
jgi:hypothetical protein